MLAKKIGVCYNKRNKQFFEFSWMKKSMQKEELIMKITITAKKNADPPEVYRVRRRTTERKTGQIFR